MKNIALLSVCLLLGGCYFFSNSRSTLTINVDESFKHRIQRILIHFGSEKSQNTNLNPGDSSSYRLFPTSINSHLDFQFDVDNRRYYWASWESDLFGKTFADKFFKRNIRYQIIIDLKPDYSLFIKVYQRDGLFSKKLIVQGTDKAIEHSKTHSGQMYISRQVW